MDSDWNRWLREMAYGFWEEDGRPDDKQEDHWRKAEAKLREKAEQSEALNPAQESTITTGEESPDHIRRTEGP